MSEEWTDLDWSWDELFTDDDEIIVDEAYITYTCNLENPETCESCS
jgi:hypothetical protein